LISDLEFENALQLIASYQLQLDENFKKKSIRSNRKIDIQHHLQEATFKALQNYYLHEYKIILKKEDLRAMDVDLLGSINYKKLQGYRGFGKVRLFNFKKLMISYSVLVKEEL